MCYWLQTPTRWAMYSVPQETCTRFTFFFFMCWLYIECFTYIICGFSTGSETNIIPVLVKLPSWTEAYYIKLSPWVHRNWKYSNKKIKHDKTEGISYGIYFISLIWWDIWYRYCFLAERNNVIIQRIIWLPFPLRLRSKSCTKPLIVRAWFLLQCE